MIRLPKARRVIRLLGQGGRADMPRKFTFIIVPLLAFGAACLSDAVAQSQYPDKPIRLVVPQAPGSATDTVARILAAELGPQLGQQIIVENRPGGALTIGIDVVAKAAPDGYTLGVGPIG